jgi:hypothetical protein
MIQNEVLARGGRGVRMGAVPGMPKAKRADRLSRWLIVAGAVALLLALPLTYLDRNVVQTSGFADNAVRAVQADAVRAEAAVTRALLTRNPRLVAAAPLVASATESALGGSLAAGIVRRAAAETHRAIFSGDAVDFVERGDVVGAAAALNGVAAPP